MLEVTEAKFGFNGDLKATMYYKIKRHVGEEKGKFHVGFMVVREPEINKNPILVVFKETPKNAIGICDPIIAQDWVKSVIENQGYFEELIYYTGVERVSSDPDAFMMDVPVGGIKFTDVKGNDLEGFKKTLDFLQVT